MTRKQIKSKLMVLIAAAAFVIIGSAGMSMMFGDAAYAIEPDDTNYDLKAVPTAQGLDVMPGVYTVKATVNNGAANPATIGIPSVAKQNLTLDRGATKELPAIVMGAAVNYEVRTGPTEFTPIEGAKLLPPYSYFRWGVMDEQTKEADGTTTTHKKLSGFDGSYYIVRVDVSDIIADAKEKAEKAGGSLDGKYLHVRQQNNKALLVATGMTDYSFVYVDTSQTNNKGGCKAAAYSLDNDAEAMKDTEGNDADTPYLDVILLSSAKNVAGADAGGESAPVSNIDLCFYVDDTKDYKPWLQALDPNNMPTFPYKVKNDKEEEVTFETETDYNAALTTKFFDEELATEANSASYFKVMGEDLEIDVAIDNNEEVQAEAGDGQQYRSIDWLKEKMDFWSMENAIAYEKYDDHTIILICEVPVLDAMNISGTEKRSVILDVNSFDIQIANNSEQGKAGLTIGKNAQLRIKDGSNTAGAELAIGNNANMLIEDGGVMVIDETCTAEAEFDAASTVDPAQTPTEYLSGEITVKNGGKLINHGVINIEGTEGKPLDPTQQEQVIRDKKCADIMVENGGLLDNYGCLSLKGVLYIMGTLNNYGQYNDIIQAYDPDKNRIDYHRGIQVTWKDDVTQEGVEPGVLNVGIDADKNVEESAELNNYGDIVIVPGTFNLYGVFNNAGKTEDRDYAGHLYLCTVTEAIIPIVDPNDPLVVEKKVQLEKARESVFNNQGIVNNNGAIDSASVELIHNGILGKLTPVITSANKEVTYSADGIDIPVNGLFTIPDGAGDAAYTVTPVTGEGTVAENKLTVTKCGTFLVTVKTAAAETLPTATASATLTVNKADCIVKAPGRIPLTDNGKSQELVSPGEATGGTMKYALGRNKMYAPDASAFTESIPKGSEPEHIYCVWYMVVGDAFHNDTKPECITTTIFQDIVPMRRQAAIDELAEYSETKAATDATEKERAAIDKVVADGKAAINAATDAAGIEAAFNDAIKAVDATVVKIENDREAAAQIEKTKAEKVTAKKAKAKKKGKATVTWRKVAGASSYQVAYSTSKQFSKKAIKKVKAKTSKTTLKKLKAGKKYYVKVRVCKELYNPDKGAYEIVYGKWSNVKKFKAKK